MIQNLLNIVEGKATEDGKAAVEPDVFGECESSNRGRRNDEGSEARDGDNGRASKQRAANVQVFLLLRGRSDEGYGTHHSNCVKSGPSDECGWAESEERCDECSLGGVEGGPKGVLGNIARTC